MKRMLFVLAALFIIFVIADGLNPGEYLNAAGGCCMERRDLNKDYWRRNGMSFTDCRNENNRRDNNDNLYQPIGYIYWKDPC